MHRINTWLYVSNLDIDATILGAGQVITSTFQLRFGQEDNWPFNYDGRIFDDIQIIECSGVNILPWSEDFSEGSLPGCWQNIDNLSNGQEWQFNNPGGRTINTSTNANGFAILDSDNYGSGNSQDADLISPIFDFSGI